MSRAEFLTLLAGLLPDTPLGLVVAIRAENDFKRIKAFTAAEKKIYNDWRRFRALQWEAAVPTECWEAEILLLEKALAEAFGGRVQ